MSNFLDAPWRSPRAVSSVLVVAPAEEPITLAEAKLRANLTGAWIDGDPRDALLTGMIRAARSKIEMDTGLALIKQTRLVTIALWGAGGIVPLPMHALPLISIANADGSPIPTDIVGGPPLVPVPPSPAFPVLTLDLARGVLRTTTTTIASYQIESGWADAATLAAEAPLLTHACGLLTAHYATLGRDLASVEETFAVPLGYEEAIAPYRLVWVT